MNAENELIIGTDFSGLGSPEEAIKRLQVKHSVAFACDKDKFAKASYLANHNPRYFYDDIVTRDQHKTPYCDGYFFGFPCQAFSNAGLRLGFEDTRGTLFFNSLEYIGIHRPRFFVAENVKGLLSHDKPKGSKSKYGKTFNVILDALAATVNGQHNLHKYPDCVNYHVYYAVLNTKEYGIPQNRERVFIVGFREEADDVKFRMPKGFKLTKRLKDVLEAEVDEKYNLSDTMIEWLLSHSEKAKEKGHGFNFTPSDCDCVAACVNSRVYKMGVDDNYVFVSKEVRTEEAKAERHKTGTNGYRAKEIIFEPADVINCLPTELTNDHLIAVPEANKKGYSIAKDGDSINLSNPESKTRRGRVGKGVAQTLDTSCNQAVIQLNPSTESNGVQPYQQNRVYSGEGLAPALSVEAAHTTNVLYDYIIRRLTPKECFLLQGYTPDFFEKCAAINSDTQLYKQAGNSITVDVIMYLLVQIFKALDIPFKLN